MAGKERLRAAKERGAARVIMLRSSTVPWGQGGREREGEDVVRKGMVRKEGRRVSLYARSLQPPLPVSFSYEPACPAASLLPLPLPLAPVLRHRCTPRGDKERDAEGKGTAKRRGQEGKEGG